MTLTLASFRSLTAIMNITLPSVDYSDLRRIICCLASVLGISTSIAAIPGYPQNITEYDSREVGLLPPYCIYTQSFRDRVPGGNNQTEIKRWYAVVGDVFHSMHHYCWGLMKTNRALYLARSQEDREFYLSDSIGEFDYVIRHAKADFVLLPEIFTKKGENLLRLGRGEGVSDLMRAIELKPDYWPPYAILSDHHSKKLKDFAGARDWLQKGLLASPESLPLQKKLTELDGKAKQESPPASKARSRPQQDKGAAAP